MPITLPIQTRNVTAIDLIRRAYRLIGVYSTGEPLSPDESIDGLSALNSMISIWANESLMTYSKARDIIPLTAGVGVYTIGETGSTVAVRPVQVLDSSYVDCLNVSNPLSIVTLEQYNSITYKQLSGGVPSTLLYEPDYPNGTITVYPLPVAGCVLNLWSRKPLSIFPNLTDLVILPPGYEDAIVFNLAVLLAPENEVQPSPIVVRAATNAKRLLKRTNNVVPVMNMPAAIASGYANTAFGRYP